MSDQTNYDAREYQTSNFIKKEDLKRDGPQRLTIHSIETTPGFKKNGQETPDVLLLVFADERRLSLGTQANLKRLIDWFGPLTSAWLNKTIEAYYSPDVRGPGGEEGGIRLRLPEGRSAVTSPDYGASLRPGPDVPFEQSELPPAPVPAPPPPKAAPPVLDMNNPEDFAMIREAIAAYQRGRAESSGA